MYGSVIREKADVILFVFMCGGYSVLSVIYGGIGSLYDALLIVALGRLSAHWFENF